ncbi:arsenite efflux transporter metallochaperone ArsD [Bacillus sp. KH172YL63]|uniref:arsenite efflux transporter metallochaperone ArsD n=1 Tax=Bacillus sp. KH172YL63 TaxID=2709784 RepID=UPI0013E513BF|nr:arsenite efflux transporter metallochaperone ArsD [Bacillus sp. KH172YL63]BCB04012.1 arsenical resistance operon transcriptional repressor ArsD [Bacillus sp. KH172YL63]
MKKIEIFDPAMCCSTGVCGPGVDPELTRIASAVYSLEQKGYSISRYQLTTEPAAFAENPVVSEVLKKKGPDALPLILLDGEAVRSGSYPSNEELAGWFGLSPEELTKKPKVRLSLDLKSRK